MPFFFSGLYIHGIHSVYNCSSLQLRLPPRGVGQSHTGSLNINTGCVILEWIDYPKGDKGS